MLQALAPIVVLAVILAAVGAAAAKLAQMRNQNRWPVEYADDGRIIVHAAREGQGVVGYAGACALVIAALLAARGLGGIGSGLAALIAVAGVAALVQAARMRGTRLDLRCPTATYSYYDDHAKSGCEGSLDDIAGFDIASASAAGRAHAVTIVWTGASSGRSTVAAFHRRGDAELLRGELEQRMNNHGLLEPPATRPAGAQ